MNKAKAVSKAARRHTSAPQCLHWHATHTYIAMIGSHKVTVKASETLCPSQLEKLTSKLNTLNDLALVQVNNEVRHMFVNATITVKASELFQF